MNNLKSKLKKQGGFTLVEMLIVVAIIAILIAISIPTVTGALEKSRQATDAANERAAKAEIMIHYLTRDKVGKDTDVDFAVKKVYAYDAKLGKLVAADGATGTSGAVSAYGQCTSGDHPHTGCILFVTISEDGEVYMQWSNEDKTGYFTTNTGLCSDIVSPATTTVDP